MNLAFKMMNLQVNEAAQPVSPDCPNFALKMMNFVLKMMILYQK